MDYLYIIIPSLLLLLIFITILLFHFKKKSVIKKVNSLSTTDKQSLLDTLAEPLGYCYDASQDIFATRLDAPQKIFGYNTFYDFSAPYFNMVFDYETIYFDYNARTWLVEMWKGQYGINAGCELGIYYADTVVPPEEYSSTHFTSVAEKDMLEISLDLNKVSNKQGCRYTDIGHLHDKHWWLTIFKMGVFVKPRALIIDASIRFKDRYMLYSFLNRFENTLPHIPYIVNDLTVSFSFSQSGRQYSFFKKCVRSIALTACKVYCKWFLYITRPFSNGGDKLLYLYYYLPFAVRFIFKKKNKK